MLIEAFVFLHPVTVIATVWFSAITISWELCSEVPIFGVLLKGDKHTILEASCPFRWIR